MKVNYIKNPTDIWGQPRLAEIDQTSKDLMAIGKPTGEKQYTNYTPWCHCREFFNDLITYYYNRVAYTIFGFDLKEMQEDIVDYWDTMVLLVRVHNKKYSDKILKEITNTVLKLETEAFGGQESTIELDDDRKHVVINFAKFWVRNPYLFSLYTREVRWGYMVATKLYTDDQKYNVGVLKYPERNTNLIDGDIPITYNSKIINYISKIPVLPHSESLFYIHEHGYASVVLNEYKHIKEML